MFDFVNCDIKGGFLFGCPATNAADGTHFSNCRFSDAGTEEINYKFLVESNGAKYLSFDNCDFRVAHKALVYVSPAGEAEEEKPVFNNCHFQTDYKADITLGKIAGLYTTNTKFTGNTTFINNAAERLTWNIASSNIDTRKGNSANVTIGKGFTLLTYEKIRLGSINTTSTLTVESGGALMIYHNAGLSIEKGSTLVLKKGGALWIAPGVSFVVRGAVIVEDGASICINESAKMDKATQQNIVLKVKQFSAIQVRPGSD